MQISDFMDQTNRTESPQALLNLMERAIGDLGFNRYAYCALTRHDQYQSGNNPAPAVALNYPASWTDYYFEHRYDTVDPVLIHTRVIGEPFLWEWLPLNGIQRTVMAQAKEAGLRDGVGVPLHGAFGNVCLVTFAAGDGRPEPEVAMRDLNILAVQFHAVYSSIGRCFADRRMVPVLSEKERACLQWVALGKTSCDVGDILHISENTVNYHMKSAFKKLDASNRISAVVSAIRYGLISL